MSEWTTVCKDADLIPGTGVCALFNDEQIAIFKMAKSGDVYALNNYDPIGKANVLSRGITGSIGDALVVASPLYKQHFNLLTGECLENSEHSVKVYPVRVNDGEIQLKSA